MFSSYNINLTGVEGNSTIPILTYQLHNNPPLPLMMGEISSKIFNNGGIIFFQNLSARISVPLSCFSKKIRVFFQHFLFYPFLFTKFPFNYFPSNKNSDFFFIIKPSFLISFIPLIIYFILNFLNTHLIPIFSK